MPEPVNESLSRSSEGRGVDGAFSSSIARPITASIRDATELPFDHVIEGDMMRSVQGMQNVRYPAASSVVSWRRSNRPAVLLSMFDEGCDVKMMDE